MGRRFRQKSRHAFLSSALLLFCRPLEVTTAGSLASGRPKTTFAEEQKSKDATFVGAVLGRFFPSRALPFPNLFALPIAFGRCPKAIGYPLDIAPAIHILSSPPHFFHRKKCDPKRFTERWMGVRGKAGNRFPQKRFPAFPRGSEQLFFGVDEAGAEERHPSGAFDRDIDQIAGFQAGLRREDHGFGG